MLVGFKIGDLFKSEPFVHKKGKNAGKTGISLKARLLRINHVMINGRPYEINEDIDGTEAVAEPEAA